MKDNININSNYNINIYYPNNNNFINWINSQVKLQINKFENNNLFEIIRYSIPTLQEGMVVNLGKTHLAASLRGDSLTNFNNANSYLGVGDSSTAANVVQTDLQAATNKVRKAMDVGYPLIYGEGGGPANPGEIMYRSTFLTSEALFAWNEFALFNASTSGLMLDRFVYAAGTKPNTQIWELNLILAF